jgi:YgiT-type zinc finger domain-containing protein
MRTGIKKLQIDCFHILYNNRYIIILKNLPTYQCGSCSEYLLEDSVAARIEEIFDTVNAEAELEILEYAA